MGQMTGIVVRHRDVEGRQRKLAAGEHLADVASLRGEGLHLWVVEPVTVLLHRRTATGRVRHHEIDAVAEGPREGTRSQTKRIEAARMQLERATAALGPRHDDVVPRHRQETRGVAVHAGIDVPLYAAHQEARATATRSASRNERRESFRAGQRPEERVHRGESRGAREESAPSQKSLESGRTVEAERLHCCADAPGPREECEERVVETTALWLAVPLEAGTRRLQQTTERNARRARRLARAAAEAEIEMTDERLARGDPALGRCAHQVQAPARGIHLLSEREIGRTLRQTDSAVNALSEIVEGDRVVLGGSGDWGVG